MTIAKKNIGVLILAAGASSRMGRPKQLLPWKDTTLLGNAVQNATSSDAKSMYIILGANAERIRTEIIDRQIEIIVNPDWESGIGSSIATGINHLLKKSTTFDGILILLADQPLIDTEYLNALIVSFYNRSESIIATAYKNGVGVPALFDEMYFSTLSNLNEDFGAKALIGNSKDRVFIVNPEDKAADIDTKSEYEKLIKEIK